MIQLQKYRTITVGNTYEVYRNLNKGNFSIRDKKSKLVVAIGTGFIIQNVIAKVSQKGIERVRREKRKSVVACLQGTYAGEIDFDTSRLDELYFNPYTLNCFINKRTGESLDTIGTVYFSDNKAWIVED